MSLASPWRGNKHVHPHRSPTRIARSVTTNVTSVSLLHHSCMVNHDHDRMFDDMQIFSDFHDMFHDIFIEESGHGLHNLQPKMSGLVEISVRNKTDTAAVAERSLRGFSLVEGVEDPCGEWLAELPPDCNRLDGHATLLRSLVGFKRVCCAKGGTSRLVCDNLWTLPLECTLRDVFKAYCGQLPQEQRECGMAAASTMPFVRSCARPETFSAAAGERGCVWEVVW
jgi:hypothetical protein